MISLTSLSWRRLTSVRWQHDQAHHATPTEATRPTWPLHSLHRQVGCNGDAIDTVWISTTRAAGSGDETGQEKMTSPATLSRLAEVAGIAYGAGQPTAPEAVRQHWRQAGPGSTHTGAHVAGEHTRAHAGEHALASFFGTTGGFIAAGGGAGLGRGICFELEQVAWFILVGRCVVNSVNQVTWPA